MPITPELTWEQDATAVRVFIPLKGISRKTVDLYASETFVKVNFPPYLLMLDLHAPIADHDARASYRDGMLVLSLPKQHEGAWPALQAEGLDKAALRDRREASMEKRRNEDEALGKARRQRQQEASDLAFRRQMALENAEREQLEARKAEAKDEAEARVYEALALKKAEEDDWMARNKHLIDARRRAVAKDAADAIGEEDASSIQDRDPDWLKAKGDDLLKAGDLAGAANAYGAALQRDPAHLGALGNRAVARLRLGHDTAAALDCTTALSLLPRPPVDPAPALPPVDLALLRKQADAAAALAAEMSTKGKGAPGPAAPSAEASEVRSDRRATIAAAETADAAAALIGSAGVSERPELSSATPLGPRRALQRCLARRAAALLHMGQFARAAADFRAAAECARRDPGAGASGPSPASVAAALEEEAASADRLLEAETLKRNGDAQLLAKDPAAALPHYAASLAVQPGFVPALVNRAGAHASLKDLAACERDASAALEALGIGEAETSVAAAVQAWAAAGEMPAFVPAWGSVRLSAWIKTACLRRAAARMRMGRPKDASRDFRKAVELDPLNARIMRDMQQATAAVLVATGAVRESTVEAETASAAGTA